MSALSVPTVISDDRTQVFSLLRSLYAQKITSNSQYYLYIIFKAIVIILGGTSCVKDGSSTAFAQDALPQLTMGRTQGTV